ncbi:MAG: aldehyde dehydrogenase family protein, partial [Rhizomicrobium sp.]
MTKVAPLPASSIQTRLLIGGKWVDGAAGTEIDVFNPYDGSKIVAVAEAREADVDRAVEAARAAAPGW